MRLDVQNGVTFEKGVVGDGVGAPVEAGDPGGDVEAGDPGAIDARAADVLDDRAEFGECAGPIRGADDDMVMSSFHCVGCVVELGQDGAKDASLRVADGVVDFLGEQDPKFAGFHLGQRCQKVAIKSCSAP